MTLAEKAKSLEGVFQFDPQIKHHFSSGVYAKQMVLPKDFFVISHKHNFDHLSILASGTVIVKTDDSEQEYTGPACLTIKANTHHEITALTDSVWFCVHATEETDESKVDEVLISHA
jgi:quercetin dioxygenase-like cupin family protein